MVTWYHHVLMMPLSNSRRSTPRARVWRTSLQMTDHHHWIYKSQQWVAQSFAHWGHRHSPVVLFNICFIRRKTITYLLWRNERHKPVKTISLFRVLNYLFVFFLKEDKWQWKACLKRSLHIRLWLIYTPNWKTPLCAANPEALSIEINLTFQISWWGNGFENFSIKLYRWIHLGGNISDIISVLSNHHWQQKTFWKCYSTI